MPITNYGMNSDHRLSSVLLSVLASVMASLCVTVGVLWSTGNLKLSNKSIVANPIRKAPALIGLTAKVAGTVIRSRDLKMVIQGERADTKVEPGRIAWQDPMAESDMNAGDTVRVVLSSGVKKQEVPPVVGKSLEEAKSRLKAAGLVVGKVLETRDGAPGTVTEVVPKSGTLLTEGEAVTLIFVPIGVVVPDVVGGFMRNAKKSLAAAGLKTGKIRWRYDEDKKAYIILRQKPGAGMIVAPGASVDLLVNEQD